MKQKKFIRLLDRYIDGSATATETTLVEAYLDELEKGPVKQRTIAEEKAIQARMFKKIQAGKDYRNHVVISLPNSWKIGIAAATLVAAISVWFVLRHHQAGGNSLSPVVATNDVKAPEMNRATITLSDGNTVFLDNTDSGQLALQGTTRLVKMSEGQLAYQHLQGREPGRLQYNTVSNPKGSKVIDMVLSDGSHLWLNSGSSVTFPVAFIGNQRKVSMDGEAYFEVAHDPSKPFIVSKGVTSVQVLGTHFNINAYGDEHDIKVTLLEGSVKVNSRDQSALIRPGQQASIAEGIKVRQADVDEVMSWKEGIFLLDNTDLPTLMRQISRWYDVTIVYEGTIPSTRFGGGLSKNQPLSKILETLEGYGLHFQLKGKTLMVK